MSKTKPSVLSEKNDTSNASGASTDLLAFAEGRRFSTIMADPPWQFQNRTGKVAPEHRRLSRYETMTLDDILGLPIRSVSADTAHLYLWVPTPFCLKGSR